MMSDFYSQFYSECVSVFLAIKVLKWRNLLALDIAGLPQ